MTAQGPRPRPSRAMRERIFERSGGVCEHCGEPIALDTFHVAHLRAHSSGGALVESNLEAWCSRCNLVQGAVDVRDPRTLPRAWQLEALDQVVARITSTGVATVAASPGAGKTIFAGLVFEALYEADVVDRMVVLAPRVTLVKQWADALAGARHLQLRPGGEVVERLGQVGVVTTYQSLSVETIGTHRKLARQERTLLALDEVHHLGERESSAWARNVHALAGEVDVELHVAAVLNLSGTLFRTRADERISTVRYRPLPDGKIQAQADYEIPTERLILDGQLRPIDLHTIDGKVEMFDTARFEMVSSNMVDLDEKAQRAALRDLSGHKPWLRAFVAKVLAQLQEAHQALEGHPVKALIVAARQEEARIYRDEVNRQMRELGLSPFAELAISDDAEAAATLERFRRSPDAGVLCTVDMAGEGYDCSDIAVIGYASNKLARLYVQQVVARAMRVTDTERRLGLVIPAVVVMPRVEKLVSTLSEYLKPFLHEVMLEAQREREAREVGEGQLRLGEQPYIIDSIMPGRQHVTVPTFEGPVTLSEQQLAEMAGLFAKYNVPQPLQPRFAAAITDWVNEQRRANPFDPGFAARDAEPTEQERREPTIEETCEVYLRQVVHLERWWSKNGDEPIGVWAGRANKTSGLPASNGRKLATPEQLAKLLKIERDWVGRYCTSTGIRPPGPVR